MSLLTRALVLFVFVLAISTNASILVAEVTAEKHDEKVTIKIDGDLFAEYLTYSGGKPVVWPIIGPTGKAMTRSYPMKKVEGEKTDHIHHRSLWFTHGDVNGVDFWLEGAKGGKQIHQEFVRVEGGKQAVVITRNDWVAPNKEKVCEDERTLRFFADGDHRVIDFDIVMKATDKPLVFGDTKEGSFGIRVAHSVSVDARQGGRIVNSEGQTDDKAWGKRAAWVDYYGPIAGDGGKEKETLGIAILNHPSSFRFPTWWHVRTYGLFAANPFGIHDFEQKQKGAGTHTVAPGETIAFRYRVVFHKGNEQEGGIAKEFTAYAAENATAAK